MGPCDGNNKRIVDPSTSWPVTRATLKDCHKICCKLFDEDLQSFRPILYGCRRPCCNVQDAVQPEEVPDHTGAYLEIEESTKRCSLSPVQGTGLRSVPGYTPYASFSLTSSSSSEETAEESLDTAPEYKHDRLQDFLRREAESTGAGGDCERPTIAITTMLTPTVNDDINDDALKCYECPCRLLGGVKSGISNENNVVKKCACGVVDCICLMTTEDEDSDDSDYSIEDGYYSCC